jgi:hypothetical protein
MGGSRLPVYLVGLGLMTYFSTFGGSGASTHQMGVWLSLGVTAVFALIIYFWAVAVALPRHVIERMIEEVVLPEEEDLAVPAGH